MRDLRVWRFQRHTYTNMNRCHSVKTPKEPDYFFPLAHYETSMNQGLIWYMTQTNHPRSVNFSVTNVNSKNVTIKTIK